MIRAYVAPTDQPVIWVEVPSGRVDWDYGPSFGPGRAYVELTPDESAELREQMHHAEALARLECETTGCTRHACYDDGGCHEHGRAS